MTAHVSPEKKRVAKEFADLMGKYPVVALVNMENLPAPQLQRMRASLREQGIVLKMTKGRIIKKALEQSGKQELKLLEPHITGMPALIFTKENPFALFKLLKKSQSKAPIKGGQKAPDDIIVPAGPTSFAPGPVIGEMGAVGIKAGIDGGKVAVKADSKVAKVGDVVSPKLAALLTRLGIEPMRIGLNIVVVFENGEILTRAVLDVDEDAVKAQLVQAHFAAIAVAMEAAYPAKDTVTPLVQKGFMDAVTLALDRDVVAKDTIKPLVGKAYAMSLALAGLLPDEALSAEAQAAAASSASASAPAEAKKEDKKKDDKKSEESAAAGLGALFG